MTRLLHMDISPRKDESESVAVTKAFVDAYVAGHPGTEVDVFDVWANPLPAFDGDAVGAKMTVIGGEAPTGAQAAAWDEVVAVFNRFSAAELYVFGVPIWNSGIPWVLKQFIDIVTQPGMCWGLDPATGYIPLLKDKRAVTVYTSALWAAGVTPAWGRDFLSPYFRDWLNFIGVSEVHEIRFQPTMAPTGGPVDERRQIALDEARALAAKL